MFDNDKLYYKSRNKLLSHINALPKGKTRDQFFQLLEILNGKYAKYSSSCIDARVRPSPKAITTAECNLAEYYRFKNEIEMSLTLAKLFMN